MGARTLGGRRVSPDAPPANALGESCAPFGLMIAGRAQVSELDLRAENDELSKLDAVGSHLLAQLVKRCLDRRRLGDRVASAVRRHAKSVAPVSHPGGLVHTAAALVSDDPKPRATPSWPPGRQSGTRTDLSVDATTQG